VPSSISSFEPLIRAGAKTGSRFRSWILYTLVCLACFCTLVELLTRIGFTRISHIESRTAEEHKAALRVRQPLTAPTMLILGNSLPLEGIDLPQLKAAFEGRANITRFVIEQTEYLDWYYGIRRLFQDGSKPTIVILCIDMKHLLSQQIRGDYSAFYLFQLQDIPAVSRDAGYDLTQASGLVFAHYSLFYAGRTSLRNFLLNRIDPPYANLLHNLGNAQAKNTVRRYEETAVTERLTNLRLLCTEKGSRFIFLLPPGFNTSEQRLLSAGERTGTTVMIPIHLNAFGSDKFRDGYHLNEVGRHIFTKELASRLQRYLEAH